MERIKFYNKNDLSLNTVFFDRVECILNDFLEYKKGPNTIEDAIEFQNIIKVIDEKVFSKYWRKDFILKIKEINPKLKKIIDQYLRNREPSEILDALKTCKNIYLEDFFYNFERYKYGEKVSKYDFERTFHEAKIPIQYLLKSNYFSKVYPEFLKNSIIKNPKSIELLLSNFSNTIYSNNSKKLTFPDNISKTEWNELLDKYIKSPDANFNCLTILSKKINNLDHKKFFSVTPKQKVEIEDKLDNFKKKIEFNSNGLKIISKIFLKREEFETAIKKSKERNELTLKDALEKFTCESLEMKSGPQNFQNKIITLRRLVDKEKIQKSHDFKSLLNFYQIDSKLFSKRIISTLPSFPNDEIGPLMKLQLSSQTNRSYPDGAYFQIKQQFAITEIEVISEILNSFNIRNEDLFKWFFNEYCKDIYKTSWLSLPFPNPNEFIGNQTATLFRIEESIRKQYCILVNEKKIESNLVEATPTPAIATLPSFSKSKYAYCKKSNTANKILFLLFSDQSCINYVNKKLNGESFAELIKNNKVKKSQFAEYQKEPIHFLLKNDILEEKNGYLIFKNRLKINLLHEIYLFGSTNFLCSSDEEKKALKDLEKRGLIFFQKTLFTQQESDYIDFLLNNKFFDNSWAIRNKYQHNTPCYIDQRKYVNENILAQLVLLIYIIKINDELSYSVNEGDNYGAQ